MNDVRLLTVRYRTLGGTILAALAVGCCGSPPHANMARDGALYDPWYQAEPLPSGSTVKLLNEIVDRYAACGNYRDHGVINSTRVDATSRATRISYFDTLFVRHHGMRFRLFDEQKNTKLIVWSLGETTNVWFRGALSERTSIEDAIGDFRGVTDLASYIVPSLLLHVPYSRWANAASGGPRSVGIAPVECGKCPVVAFGSEQEHQQAILTIDESRVTVRRFEAINQLRGGAEHGLSLGGAMVDALIVYEPELDLPDDTSLVRELDIQPW